jgi:acyl-CoA reductase-like NAD-dependent aldehyde dehydrogenase
MASNQTKSQALNLKDNYVQIINGKSGPTEKTHRGINPATLEQKLEVPIATQENVNQAVEAGKKAFKSWSKVPWNERKNKLLAFADAFGAQMKEFADLLVSEQGKTVRHSH